MYETKTSYKKISVILAVFVIIFFQENAFYLSGTNTIMILSILGLFFLLFNIVNIFKGKYFFGGAILAIIISLIYAVVIAKLYYEQPIATGFYGAHFIFIYGWYFFLRDLIRGDTENELKDLISRELLVVGTVIVFLVIIQGFLYPKLTLLHLTYAYRDGVRIYGCYIATPVLLVALSREIETHSKSNIFVLAVVGFYLLYFNQSRSLLIIVTLTLLFLYVRHLKIQHFGFRPMDVLIATTALGFVAIIWQRIYQMISSAIIEFFTVTGNGGVRVQELSYYFVRLKQNHFLGIGQLADQFGLTKYIYNTVGYMYLDDIGMVSFIFKTGIIGLGSLIYFLVRLSAAIRKQKNGWQKYLGVILLCQIFFGILTTQFLDSKYMLIYYLLMLVLVEPPTSSYSEK